MASEEVIISLNNVVKQFDDFKAVDNFTLDIKKGQFVTILGPSGCGKTTTLRMIGGFELPSSGTILLNNQDITLLPPYKRPINTVFQRYALFPHLNVYNNVAFGLKLKKVEYKKTNKKCEEVVKQRHLTTQEIDELVYKALEIVDLEELEDRDISTLSGGQQQRVAIARALAKSPRVLLLDEPLSNLDARLRLQTREEIRRIQQETGITSVFVTHDQEEAMSISDKIVVMKLGEMQQMGAPQEVYNSPANLFVAQFLGTPPINVFKGAVKGEKIYVGEDCVGEAKGIKDQEVSVAIRPEGFVLADEKEKGVLHAECEMIQVMGRDISVVAKNELCTKPTFKAIISADDKVNPGKVAFKVKPHKIFIFDAETDERIYIK